MSSSLSTRMKITDLMQRKARGPTSATQAPGIPGGHKLWCSGCNGFRVHAVKLFGPNEAIKGEVLQELALQKEGTRLEVRLSKTQETPSLKARLAIVCRSCGRTSVLVRQAGVWMSEAWGKRLDYHVRRRTAELLGQLDRALMAAVTGSPVSEMPEGSRVDSMAGIKRLKAALSLERSMGTERKIEHALIDRVVDVVRNHDLGDVGSSESESGGHATPPRGSLGAKARVAMREASPAAANSGLSSETRFSARTKAKVAGWALSAPFLLMGALYVLAWRGTYIWPIYYAIRPYWQSWMNEWWFAALSLIVPGMCAFVYRFRFGPLPEMPTE